MQIQCGQMDDPVGLAMAGPTALVCIGFDPEYREEESDIPNLPKEHFHALVDTGASVSCLDAKVAHMLDLPIVDEIEMSGVGGVSKFMLHSAQIYIPQLEFTIAGRFAGVHLYEGGQEHGALLGRDFLADMHMVYDGKTGSVTIART